MTIIDSHQHVFWRGRNDADLIADMEANHISRAWLLSWNIPKSQDHPPYHRLLDPRNLRADGTHSGIPIGPLVEVRQRYPDKFDIGYCPDPSLISACDLLYSAVEIHKVAICGEWKFRMLFDDPRNLRLMQTAGELGLPVVLHLDIPWVPCPGGGVAYDPLWYGGDLGNLERCISACPGTDFIGHAPGFWREISTDASEATDLYPATPVQRGGRLRKLFNRYSNLYADLSANSGLIALRRDMNHAVEFLETYSERILFGRDDYGNALLQSLEELPLCQETREKILYRNATKLIS